MDSRLIIISTFFPICVDHPTCQAVADLLQCQTESFPCTYLGLPLSPNKITHGLLMPVIQKVDKRLSGWLATFLSWGGRLTLINSVLAAIPSYFMGCFLWPKQSLDKLEQILRGFLWQGQNKAKGGHCLVAWGTVTLPKINGGLGVRDLRSHNLAMICKFMARIQHQTEIPCYNWFAQSYCRREISWNVHSGDTTTWRCLKSSLKLVLEATKCILGDGRGIFF